MEVNDTVKVISSACGWDVDTEAVVKVVTAYYVLIERVVASPEIINGLRCHGVHLEVVV